MNDDPARFTCTVVTPDGTAVRFPVTEGKPILNPLVGKADAPIGVGCRGGGCGICRVQVLQGRYQTRRMSRRHVSEDEERSGVALSCRLLPSSDLIVRYDPSPNWGSPSAAE